MNKKIDPEKLRKRIIFNAKFLKYFGPFSYILGIFSVGSGIYKKDIFLIIVGLFILFWIKKYRKPYMDALEQLEESE